MIVIVVTAEQPMEKDVSSFFPDSLLAHKKEKKRSDGC